MYCKKCGKKLSDNSRFCDRCGQSTKIGVNSDRRPTNSKARDLKEKSKNSFDKYDNYRKTKMKHELERKRRKKKLRAITIWSIVIGIIAAIGCGIYAHNYMIANQNDEWKKTDESVALNQEDEKMAAESEKPTVSPTESQKATEKSKSTEKANESEPQNEKCEIYTDTAYGFKCPYPKDFASSSLKNSKTRLSLLDEDGDATMMICHDKMDQKPDFASLLRDYADGLGGKIEYSRAGSNWYTISFERNEKVNHRMAILYKQNECVYYDFTYSVGSEKESEYKEFIDFIDLFLNYQVNDVK